MIVRPNDRTARFMMISALLTFVCLPGLSLAQSGSAAKQGSAAKGAEMKSGSAMKQGSTTKMTTPDIVDTAVAAGKFNTLVAAAKAAGLVGTLKSPGPLTVFAPSDDAFAKLPAGTVEELLKPANKAKLRSIVGYHVVGGKVMAADTSNIRHLQTYQGESLNVRVTDAGVMIDNAKVVTADVACSNGVIHIIDSVLMPGTKQMGSMKKEGSQAKGSGAKGSGSKPMAPQSNKAGSGTK